MKNSITALLLLVSATIFAQTDSVNVSKIEPGYNPVLTLTNEDIRRLPVSNFMELVNTAFPMLTGNPPEVKDYTFIVNGFITVNPNAINIAQIERINFYPNGSFNSQGSLSKNGSFVITLLQRKVKNAFSFSTKTGPVSLNKDFLKPLLADSFTYHKALFSLNELSFLNQNERVTVNSSFSYNKDNRPYYLGPSEDFTFDLNRYRLSNYLAYRITDQVRISGNLLLASFNRNKKYHGENMFGKFDSESNRNTRHGHASAAVEFKPVQRLTNRLSLEGNLYRDVIKMKGERSNPPSVSSDSVRTSRNYFVFLNNTEYKIHSTDKIAVDAALLLRYRGYKDTSQRYQLWGNIPGSYYGSTSYTIYKYKSYSAATSVSMLWKQFLHVHAGGVLEKSSSGIHALSHTSFIFYPEFLLSVEPTRLMKKRSLATVNFFASYRQYLIHDQDEDDLLDVTENTNQMANYSMPDISRRFHGGIRMGILHDRLNFGLSYLRDKQKVELTSGWPNNLSDLIRKGWSAEISAKIIQNERMNLKAEALAMTDTYKLGSGSSSGQDKKRPWRNMVRTTAGIGNFFLQASLLVSINQQYYDSTGTIIYDNDRNMNFLLAGYRMQLKKFFFKNLEISAQSKNMIFPKYPATYAFVHRFIGIGIALSQ